MAAADHIHKTHLCGDIEPVATAHSSIDAKSNVVGHIMLSHLNDGIQRVLQAADVSSKCDLQTLVCRAARRRYNCQTDVATHSAQVRGH